MIKKANFRILAAAMITSIITLISVPTASWAEAAYTPSSWAAEKVRICQEAGIIPPGFDSMPYNENITRKDFFELIINTCRFYGIKLPELSGSYHFTDTQDASAEYAYVLGLTQGTSPGIFSPDQTLTREMASVVLSRIRLLFEHAEDGVIKETDRSMYMFDRGGYEGHMDGYGFWMFDWYRPTPPVYWTSDGTLSYSDPMNTWEADYLLRQHAADSDEISDWARAGMADL